MIPVRLATMGIQSIPVLFIAISTIVMINPASPPSIAKSHVKPVKKIIPETVKTARFVSAVAVPPLSGPTFVMMIRAIAQMRARMEITKAITDKTVGTAEGLLIC